MRIYDLIAKKRDGGTHSREELEAIVNGFVRGEVADYQMAAWMMAVYLRGIKSTRWRWSTARFSSGIWNPFALHKNRPEENPPASDRPQCCAAEQLVGEVLFILCGIRVFLSSHPGSRNNPFAQTDIFSSEQ